MGKRGTVTYLAVLMLMAAFFSMSVLPAAAQEQPLPRLVDDADLLTEEEENGLLGRLDEISERQQCDVVIVTVDALGGASAQAYADDFYDYNGYGFGAQADGILLLVSMENRDWAISTCGYGISVFTDAGQEYMVGQFKPYLSNGDYYEAFMQFAGMCDDFITQANAKEPYDIGNLPKKKLSALWILADLAIGFAIAWIIAMVKKAKLKSVGGQQEAQAYEKEGSLNLVQNQDMFVNKTVTTRKIQRSGSSGGSKTHTSSSGRSHGGSSGKF